MTEVFGVLGDPKTWKPIREKSADELRTELEAQRAHEREVEQLVDEALAGRQAKHLAGERRANEAEISKLVDDFFADELLSIKEKRLPPDRTRDRYVETFREFARFCQRYSLTDMPATGPVMFWWLMNDQKPELVKQRANALRFMHEINKQFCDQMYLVAAEKWARTAKSHKTNSGNGAANPEGTKDNG